MNQRSFLGYLYISFTFFWQNVVLSPDPFTIVNNEVIGLTPAENISLEILDANTKTAILDLQQFEHRSTQSFEDASRKEFKETNAPTKTYPFSIWVKHLKKYKKNHGVYILYSMEDRKPILTEDLCQLELGSNYTWTLTSDLSLTLGRYQNRLEWGIRHIALADGRAVYAAGEFGITNNAEKNKIILWNLYSGSFVMRLCQDDMEECTKTMKERMQVAWNTFNCPFQFVEHELFESKLPSFEEMTNFCATELKKPRRAMNWDETLQSVCDGPPQKATPYWYKLGIQIVGSVGVFIVGYFVWRRAKRSFFSKNKEVLKHSK